jgi:hypothetical protein
MTIAVALKALAAEFERLSVNPHKVELVMLEADVERVRKVLGRPSRYPATRSVQRMAGFLVSGEPAVREISDQLADLIDA